MGWIGIDLSKEGGMELIYVMYRGGVGLVWMGWNGIDLCNIG